MTETELFRLLNESKIPFNFEIEADNLRVLKGTVTIEFSDLAAFIDEYFLPRPLFEDGTPVKVGDRFLLCGRNSMRVTDFHVQDDGSFGINGFHHNQYQRVKKPEEKPDSWEQLEKDEKKNHTEYWGCKDDDEKPCFECEHGLLKSGKSCTTNKYIDLYLRAKELAKGDSE